MKAARVFATVIFALATGAISSLSFAQNVNGPFLSKQQLVDYWQGAAGTQMLTVYLNGYQAFRHSSGFGPSAAYTYFQCSDGLIYQNCNSIKGPFSSQQQAVSAVSNMVGNNMLFTTVYLDGVLIHGGSYSPSAGSFSYKTCTATLRYIVLDNAWTHYGSITGIDCLPQL